jgi:two-component system cell cycle response regulator DivK
MSTIHALIVDDNPLNSDVLNILLTNEGVESIAIEFPKDLPEILGGSFPIHVIFLDLEFPRHDGFKLLKELRAFPMLTDVPIVAYSVHTSEIDKARKAGFDGFLGKLIDRRRFPDHFKLILSGVPVWDV